MDRSQILKMLSAEGAEMEMLFAEAARVKQVHVGECLYLRGLIEYSNVCRKNCFYCGIRCGNKSVVRYTLTEEQVLGAAHEALERGYGSVVLQAGERLSQQHIAQIEHLVRAIKKIAPGDLGSQGSLGVTLSLGEQTEQTYRRWFEAGAHRYLLRIETSDPALYGQLHPADHRFRERIEALEALRRVGYQVGTGVMIGLPGQTLENLADDILLMQQMDIDMCGMGPYIVAENTPLAAHVAQHPQALPSAQYRLAMTLKMIATLRLTMPTINIAATTALSSLSADARLRAVQCGANILMPNLTPEGPRANYQLYNDKSAQIDPRLLSYPIGYQEWGDSPHFQKRKQGIKK